jgi:trimeric autotransporter adhesin
MAAAALGVARDCRQYGCQLTSYPYRTAIGYQALGANTTGAQNTASGYQSLVANTSGYSNTANGAWALDSSTTGYRNTASGAWALSANTTGAANTASGVYSGRYNTTGTANLFLGWSAGNTNTVEHHNSSIGALSDGAAGVTNATALGYQAYVASSDSPVLGSVAGANSATVTANVGIGTTAPTARLHVVGDVKVGDYLTGPNNVVMGSGTALPTWSGNVELNNESGVGFHFRALTTKFDIGPGAGGAPTYPGLLTLSMDGKVGIGTTSPAYKLHVAGDIYTTGTYQGSDLRLKDDVQDLGYGVREVLQLRPVSYRWKDATLGPPTLGLIAQEVQPVLPELVARGTDEAGLLSLNYTGLIPVLVKAVQEQQAALSQKDAELADLRAENTTLSTRLAALEEQVARLVKRDETPQPK